MSFTIIAATNYSDTARNAVTYAAGFARTTNSKLILYNSFVLSMPIAASGISSEELQKQFDKSVLRIQTLGRELGDLFKIEVETFCGDSISEEELSSLIDVTQADLVVMGMTKSSFDHKLISKKSTSAFIRNSNIPVLAVPINARFQKISKILYACDALGFSAAKRFSWIMKLLGDFGIEIEFFSVDQSVNEIKEKNSLSKVTAGRVGKLNDGKQISKAVNSNAVISEIERVIKYYGADILVIAPKKYGFWDTETNRIKTRTLTAGLDIPLLSFAHH